MAGLCVILRGVNINKMYKKGTKRIKFYLRLIIQGDLLCCIYVLLGFLGSFGLSPSLFGRLILKILFPKGGVSLQKSSDYEKTIYVNKE